MMINPGALEIDGGVFCSSEPISVELDSTLKDFSSEYHIFAVGDSTGNNKLKFIASKFENSFKLPEGYDCFRLIYSITNTGSNYEQ
jgi:hypothetical protein